MLTEGLMVAAVSTRTAGTANRSGVGWHREPQRRQLQVQQHHRVHTDTPATAWSFSVTQRPAPTSNRTTNSTCMSLGGEVQADVVVEVGGNFVGGEAQVGGADLDQLAAGPAEPTAGAGGAAADHRVDVRWEVPQQERRGVTEVGPVGQVVVVRAPGRRRSVRPRAR
jgi:hypothetical protein